MSKLVSAFGKGKDCSSNDVKTRQAAAASPSSITTTMLKKSELHNLPVLKVLVIGDTGVGKSCLLLRFADDAFTPSFMPTIGIDFRIKEMELEGQTVKLQVWDTAGQDRFRSITNAYYRGAHGVMLVYDVTDSKSFHNVKNWMHNLDEHASGAVNRILVANKSDMVDKRVIEPDRGRALAEQYGVKFFETSAKTGTEVDSAFEGLALEVKHRVLDPHPDSDSSDSEGHGMPAYHRDEDGGNHNGSSSGGFTLGAAESRSEKFMDACCNF